MQRALLLYNPASGRQREARLRRVEAAADAFRACGVECAVQPTHGPNTAAEQARAAVAAGSDSIIVCGGDGTVNEALHGVVGSPAALGVIPLGTGNGLANDLRLPRDPAEAARLLAAGATRTVTLPNIEYTRDGRSERRYFVITAGIGADAEMVYRLALRFKQRWGMAAYYAASTRQWLTHDFPLFNAEFRDAGGQWRREQVSQVLAVRIGWFGGLLKCIAPRADLFSPTMELVLFKTRRRLTYLRYVLSIWTQRHWRVPGVECVTASDCRCTGTERIYAEADGELLGTLPVSLRMTEATVNLLVPQSLGTST
jgi:diacylglycerol kinase (ATP)